MTSIEIFTATDLACTRGERRVFAGIGFALRAGDALVLTGPNGSGKSSLLRILAGLGRLAGGRLAWKGAPIASDLAAHRARVHYVGHLDGVRPALTVAETLSFWCGLADRPRTHLGEALDVVGLGALSDTPCRFLSSGQRRRLALARLAAWHAPLWLLDEPGTGLDDAALAALAGLIRLHRSAGGVVVLSTHGALDLDRPRFLSLAEFRDRAMVPA
ncbi:MAG TPA: heme ABC exporter ATP-binding protein CcmA [Stellaceae bacterium]|nr:heme ABC exporter ATP-binding protein CcmA [Stellaceae bacterium]